ncbi:flavodoxin family protein [uncultured Sneathiella sp.]|jgi:NAD(P)H dehydrogenase (quinone)|uniref:flavodoxin family protein n=1 Tax=uncultured Sneathiella sp. TaxID=879315 RepID=UPI0030DA5C0F|tara:strand:+ start:1135 stop:1722 length:588 start_codon:yes stop_codon:yes gene_type:complete
MTKVAIIYFSGYGHTVKQAEAVEKGAASVSGVTVTTIKIPADGTIEDSVWTTLADADAIIYGSPTYMGGPAWQFKKFADESSKQYATLAWQDKVAGGFTTSASVNGDKFNTITYFITLSQQHGQLWVGTGLQASNKLEHGPGDVNWTAGYSGALAIAPSDSSPDQGSSVGDLETARLYGARVATAAIRNRVAVAA